MLNVLDIANIWKNMNTYKNMNIRKKKSSTRFCLVFATILVTASIVMLTGCGSSAAASGGGTSESSAGAAGGESAGQASDTGKTSGSAKTAAEETAKTGGTAAEITAEASSGGMTGAQTGNSHAEDAADAGKTGETQAGGTAGTGDTHAAAETAAECRGLIVIDPGHQQYANTEQEPVGPGASQTKIKVSGGTSGVASGVPEYQLTLDIGLQLRDELQNRGYEVIMVRETNEINISNSERAAVANEADADAFVRLHANGSGSQGARGAMTICQTPGNEFNGDLYGESRALSDCVLNAYTEATGIAAEYVWETDTMSGINWCRVPVTIIEMGYMTNSEEDRLMQDKDFQKKMAGGIADGIDAFMADRTPKKR